MKTILIVDDREETVWALHKRLDRAGHCSSIATNAGQAWAALRDVPVHAVVLDLHMPGVDGLTFLRELRADPAHGKTQVVIYTGRTDLIDVQELVRLGVTEILIKSTDVERVAARLVAL